VTSPPVVLNAEEKASRLDSVRHVLLVPFVRFFGACCAGRSREIKGLVASDRYFVGDGVAVAQDATAQEGPPPNAQAYKNCDLAIITRGDTNRATADFTKPIELDPKFAMPYTTAASPIVGSAIPIAPSPTSWRGSSSIRLH